MPEVLFNDASIEGQFQHVAAFRLAFRDLMEIRRALERFGLRLKICRSLLNRQITPEMGLQRWVWDLPVDAQQEVFVWINNGPFWDDPKAHDDSEYFAWDQDRAGVPVTATALAEAACLADKGADVWLATCAPSRFTITPLIIWWEERRGSPDSYSYELQNFWEPQAIQSALVNSPQDVRSWNDLIVWIERRCPFLILSPQIREQLGVEFHANVSKRCQVLLPALNDIAKAVITGDATSFYQLRSIWMEGDKARMTDAGANEKAEFQAEMTFRHPETGEAVVCFWHGKIKAPQFRIHFEWPLPAGARRLFVGYIGPKISKS